MDRLTTFPAAAPLRRWVFGSRTRTLSIAFLAAIAFPLAVSVNSIVGGVTAALGLGFVIFLHELGHFAVAKWCDVQVERFSIGFGPAIFAKTYGETEYALCWLPLGGYVKMLGQDDVDASQLADEEIRSNPRSYTNKTVPQRMAIISAGVIMNIITGTMFFAIAYAMGVDETAPIVGSVAIDSPAWNEGVEVGDRIAEINGTKVSDFTDIVRGTALSSGNLRVRIVTPEDDSYSIDTPPDTNGRRRQLGIGPVKSLKLVDLPETQTYYDGTAAADAKLPPRGTIVEVDGEPVASYLDMMAAFASKKSESVTLTVRDENDTSTVTLPPQRKRELGFHVDLAKVKSVREGSVAAAEGIKPGDRIAKVDGQDIGTEIDPVDLPQYFADRAGDAVTVTIVRKEDGSEVSTDLSIVPDESEPWLYPSSLPGYALAIPSLGVTAPLIPTALKVDEDSVAAEAGLKPTDILVSLTFVGSDGTKDRIGGVTETIDIKQTGWAYANYLIQSLPNRELTLTVNPAEGGQPKTITLPPVLSDSHIVSDRGLSLFYDFSEVRAESFVDAAEMGITKSIESAQDIYLTLRRLFGGELSPLELAGPIKIATMGYQVAKDSFANFLIFLGFLSVNLAVINFLPIPMLDGGHMVFLLWEGLTGKPLSERAIVGLSAIGMTFVLGLMLFVVALDLGKLLNFIS